MKYAGLLILTVLLFGCAGSNHADDSKSVNGKSKKLALIVGIDNFKEVRPLLHGCVNDARDMADLVRSASAPGLKGRIRDYLAAQQRQRQTKG